LECLQLDDVNQFQCLIPDQGFGKCFPADNENECPQNVDIGDVENVDTFCVLGACVIFCPSQECNELHGDCFAGICVNHDSPVMISDRAVKSNIASVDPIDMLARVRELPIATWNYTSDDPAIRHIGPMAQDFAASFGVGADDRHIHPVDGHGVALAAIQGLAADLERLRAENAALAVRLAALEGGD